MIRAIAPTASPSSSAVVDCYDILALALDAGICDFTEAIYDGDPTAPYETAQQRQAEHLLDLAGCRRGSRLLDIGCGYGRILETAGRRGALARGITVSPVQVAHCGAEGLDARLLDYREIAERWPATFDAAIANGSLEHFVAPQEAADGRADGIYRDLFDIAGRVLVDTCNGGEPGSAARFVTTAIHFGSVAIDPRDVLRPPRCFRRGSAEHHYALLVGSFGGFYPSVGQLERCAAGRFVLIGEEDGTDDYRLTSEHWLRSLKAALRRPRFLARVLAKWMRHPQQVRRLLDCLLVAQSWNWQFRGSDPPMRLLRQTWRRECGGFATPVNPGRSTMKKRRPVGHEASRGHARHST